MNEKVGKVTSPMDTKTRFPLRQFLLSSAVQVYGLLAGVQTGLRSRGGMQEDMRLTMMETMLLRSSAFLGGLAAGFLTGLLDDRMGRRRLIITSGVVGLAGWVTMTTVRNTFSLCLGQMLIGFAVVMSSIVVYVYVAEISPPRYRGTFSNIVALFGFLGVFASRLPWRYVSIGAVIVSTLLLIMYWVVLPESPRWLHLTGRVEDADDVSRWLGGQPPTMMTSEDTKLPSPSFHLPLTDWTQRRYYKPAIISILLSCSELLSSLLWSTHMAWLYGKADDNNGVPGFIVLAIGFIGWLVSTLHIDTSGRRPLLLIGLTLNALSYGTLGVAYVTREHFGMQLPGWAARCLFILILFSDTAFVRPSSSVAKVEVLPVQIQTRLLGLTTAFLTGMVSLGCLVGVQSVLQGTTAYVAFCAVPLLNLLILVGVHVLVPETKGKTLQELGDLFLENGHGKN